MTLSALLTGLVKTNDVADGIVSDITCDSERITKDCLFVCIRGTRTDGHDFAEEALLKGACAVITERDLHLKKQIVVEDTRALYAELCARFFGKPAESLRLIGVTGTNGKTTTTYMLRHIFEYCGHKAGLIGTIHNTVGEFHFPSHHTTPDAYELQWLMGRMREEQCEFAVMEASSHALTQHRMDGCTFEAAVFTNLTQDHLDYHGTMERYFEAKRRLFRQSRHAVINLDDPWSARMVYGLPVKVTTFGIRSAKADWRAQNIRTRPDGVDFEIAGPNAAGQVSLPVPGEFSVYNALGAAVCALTVGMPFYAVTRALSSFQGVKGRLEVVPTGRDFTVLIDYAHTPDGLDKVLSAVRNFTPGRLVTVFGCGGDRDPGKRPQMGEAALRHSDFAVITSDNPRTEEPMAIIKDILKGVSGTKVPYIVIENRREAIEYAVRTAQPGDIVVLAGKGHETYQILKDETIHFDEREVVAKALKQIT
ncbi:MAG: UDP-N-acetylmuramoyl-L-alanyl-D-glutamate--2,6-diaminopimelate ligase [Clostridiales bacterium]|nr:UDP-N-acetylmuramoyl-L-alanyl-D-glutamate--2,6-diaminopimelate ligase [Clostridiales bacterium]